jgi:hypothetical protein
MTTKQKPNRPQLTSILLHTVNVYERAARTDDERLEAKRVRDVLNGVESVASSSEAAA